MSDKEFNPLVNWVLASSRKTHASAMKDLAVLRRQLAGEWDKVIIPWQALERPALLEALLDSGLELGRISCHPEEIGDKTSGYASFQSKMIRKGGEGVALGPRLLALHLNAPIAAHRLLDSHGIPYLSEEQCNTAGMDFLRGHKDNSLEEMHREMPEHMETLAQSKPSILAIGVMSEWFSKKTKKTRRMLSLVNAWGAKWQDVLSQYGFVTPDKKNDFEAVCRDLEAENLAKSWDGKSQAPSSRPRL